jgi:hypothetical protein
MSELYDSKENLEAALERSRQFSAIMQQELLRIRQIQQMQDAEIEEKRQALGWLLPRAREQG